MHVDVSTSLAMIGCDRIPAAGGPAEERMISSVGAIQGSVSTKTRLSAMFARRWNWGRSVGTTRSACSNCISLDLFQLHEEALVFRREGIGIDDGRRDEIGQRALLLAAAEEAPVDREADLVGGLAGHLHRLDAARDHRLAFHEPACRRHADAIAA